MKKGVLLKGTAVGAAIAGLVLGGCRHQNVYGPPPDATDDYDPATMAVEAVYGPPEYFESEKGIEASEASESKTQEEKTDESTDADQNLPDPLYGPPSDSADND